MFIIPILTLPLSCKVREILWNHSLFHWLSYSEANDTVNTPAGTTLKNLSEEKLISFAIGSQKKSRFQKVREEQEAKKKQDEEEAAKVYKTFVQSFQDDDEEEDGERGGKRFVRGGGGRGGSGASEVYRMSERGGRGGVGGGRGAGRMSEMDKLMSEMKVKDYQSLFFSD